MRFLIRSAKSSDVPYLYRLARQAQLLNLPPNRTIIRQKVDLSMRSSASPSPPADAEYVFVLEDLASARVIGSSLIIARYASPDCPHFYLDIKPLAQRDGTMPAGPSSDCLELGSEIGGISAVGGLIVDADYRGKKLGRSISLIRFVYMCMFPERFESHILSELVGPTPAADVNPFWEALGKRFTGLQYKKALQMAIQKNKEYLARFPKEEIPLSRLDPTVRPCRERVVPGAGQAEQHLLESVGFQYLNRVDPLDGGIMYGALRDDISIVREGMLCRATPAPAEACPSPALVGVIREGQFLGGHFPVGISSHAATLPAEVLSSWRLTNGDRICVAPFVRTGGHNNPSLEANPLPGVPWAQR